MTLPGPRLFASALAGLALGACTARDPTHTTSIGPRYASLDATLDGRPSPVSSSAAVNTPARAATPVAVLPDWIGRPLRIRERDEPDAFEQIVSVSPAPRGEARENLVLLRMPRTAEAASGGAGAGAAMGGRPSEAGIRAELDSIFPGTPMQVVARPARNTYGPYGLAIGRAPHGVRCLYAWQWIEDGPALDPATGALGPLSLRVRICRDDITFEAMAAAVNQLELVPRFSGTPVSVADTARHSSKKTRRRRLVNAASAQSWGVAGRASRQAVRQASRDDAQDEVPSRPVSTEMRSAPTAREQIAPIAAAPLPVGRRYLGVAETPAAQTEFARDTAPGPAAMRGAYVGTAPSPQTGALSADLPPEALRGPSVRASGRL